VDATIYIVEDDCEVARALGMLLGAAGYRTAVSSSEIEFLRAHDPTRPGCLILDQGLPVLNGRQIQAILKESGCERPIIFASGIGTIEMTVAAVRAGAIDFLTKPIEAPSLLRAVEEALAIDATRRRVREEQRLILACLASLTPRERQVLEHLVRGRLNKQIAADLGTVEKTIKVHRSRVMYKMQARSLAELVRRAGMVGFGWKAAAGMARSGCLASWDWQVASNRVVGDRNLARLFGVASACAGGAPLETYLAAIHPEDAPRVASLIREAVEGGGSYEATYRIVQPDSTSRVVIARGRAQYDTAGRPARLPGVLVDITDVQERYAS
jgi:FixJ family two-component response regulator